MGVFLHNASVEFHDSVNGPVGGSIIIINIFIVFVVVIEIILVGKLMSPQFYFTHEFSISYTMSCKMFFQFYIFLQFYTMQLHAFLNYYLVYKK